MIQELGPVPYAAALKQTFRDGLWREWAERYPHLFDEEDVRLAGTQATHGSHFHEWLGAIVLHQTTGYLSLVEKYQFSPHTRKQEMFRALAPKAVCDEVLGRSIGAGPQCPDLVMYHPDLSDWFFCEVKGPRDTLRDEQIEFFAQLSSLSGRPVYCLSLDCFR